MVESITQPVQQYQDNIVMSNGDSDEVSLSSMHSLHSAGDYGYFAYKEEFDEPMKNARYMKTHGFVKNDPDHHRVDLVVNRKNVAVEYFITKYTPGTLIRNAISGIRESKMYVGKKYEELYFKVALSLPGSGNDRYGCLFYNSPEEYERHFHTTVAQSIKEKWLNRNL